MGERDVTVNMSEVIQWEKTHKPMAAEKLAVASLVSVRTVADLFNGKAPKLPRTRLQLARAMKIPAEKLFQPKPKAVG